MATFTQKVRRVLCFPAAAPDDAGGGPTAVSKCHSRPAGHTCQPDLRSEAHPALCAPLASSTPSAAQRPGHPPHPPSPPTPVCLKAAPGGFTAPEPPSDNEGMGKNVAAPGTRHANAAQLRDGVDLVTEMVKAPKSVRTSSAFISASDTTYMSSDTGYLSGGSSAAFMKPATAVACSGADAAMRWPGSPAAASGCLLSGYRSMPDATKLPPAPLLASCQPAAAGRVCMTVSRARSCSIEVSRFGSSRCVSGEMMHVLQRYNRLAQAGKPNASSSGSPCSKSATPLSKLSPSVSNASGRSAAHAQAQELPVAACAMRRSSGYTGPRPSMLGQPMSGIEKMGMILQLHQLVRESKSQPVQSLWQQQQQQKLQILQAQTLRQARSQSQTYCSPEPGFPPSKPKPSLSHGQVHLE